MKHTPIGWSAWAETNGLIVDLVIKKIIRRTGTWRGGGGTYGYALPFSSTIKCYHAFVLHFRAQYVGLCRLNLHFYSTVHHQWRIQGWVGGGVQGVRTPPPPPFLGHDVGFLTLGPKLDPPPFFACRPKMDSSGGSRVCVCDRGDHPAPPPWNVDDVTRAMSKGGCL